MGLGSKELKWNLFFLTLVNTLMHPKLRRPSHIPGDVTATLSLLTVLVHKNIPLAQNIPGYHVILNVSIQVCIFWLTNTQSKSIPEFANTQHFCGPLLINGAHCAISLFSNEWRAISTIFINITVMWKSDAGLNYNL